MIGCAAQWTFIQINKHIGEIKVLERCQKNYHRSEVTFVKEDLVVRTDTLTPCHPQVQSQEHKFIQIHKSAFAFVFYGVVQKMSQVPDRYHQKSCPEISRLSL